MNKRIKDILKKHIKLIIGIIIGVTLSGSVVYATTYFAANQVSYDDTKESSVSLNKTNVQDALSEVYNKAIGEPISFQLGDYLYLKPDKSTYTTPSSFVDLAYTGYMPKPEPKYYNCCQDTMPTYNTTTERYIINGTWTLGTGISGKYCEGTYYSNVSGSCEATVKRIYKPLSNADGNPVKATNYQHLNTMTGYSERQTINPNELTLWRVIDIHQDGTIDAVSEYVSSIDVGFGGSIGYKNLVGGLQTMAAQYAKSGYTIATRIMGYDGQTLTISNTSVMEPGTTTVPSETSSPTPTTGTGQEYSGGLAGDTLYLKDYQLVQNVYQQDNNEDNYCSTGLCAYQVGTTTKTDYWLASRCYQHNSNWYWAGGFYTYYTTGEIVCSNSYVYNTNYDTGWKNQDGTLALRPIITLKSGLRSNWGTGTKTNPYKLS